MSPNPENNPSPSTTVLTAHCHCGAFRKPFSIPHASLPLAAQLCSCSLCRHTTGNLFTSWISIRNGGSNLPASDSSLDLSETELAGLTKYPVTANMTFLFCETCGANVACTWKGNGEEGWNLATGMIENWQGIEPSVRKCEFLGEESTGDGGIGVWVDNDEERFKKYEGWGMPGSEMSKEKWEELVQKGKEKTKTAEEQIEVGDEHLDFWCHCGGVKGYVKRTSNEPGVAKEGGYWWLSGDKNDGAMNHQKKLRGSFCCCQSCRLTSGWEHFAWPYAAAEDIFIDGKPVELDDVPASLPTTTLRHYQSSEQVWRSFCGRCGAKVFYMRTTRNTPVLVLDIGLGLFASKAGARAEDWVVWEPDHRYSEATDQVLAKTLNEGAKKWAQNVTQQLP